MSRRKTRTDAVPHPLRFTLRLCCEGSAAKNRTPSYPARGLAAAAAAFPATLHRAPSRSLYWFLSRLASSSSSPSRLCRCGRRLHGTSATAPAPGLRRRCHPQGTGTTSCRRPCAPSRLRGAASASRRLRYCRRRGRMRLRLRRRSTSAASARSCTARRSTFAPAAGRRPARRPRPQPQAPGTRRAAPRRTAGAAPSRPRPASGGPAARRGHPGTPASRAGPAPPSWRSS